MEFVDDYRLLVALGPGEIAPQSIMLVDTRKNAGGTPVQAFFRLSPYFIGYGSLSLVLERGAHSPSPEESLVPFHQDPTQRIVAVHVQHAREYPVLRLEALLKLLESHEGSEVGWDEWKSCVVIAPTCPGLLQSVKLRVSGCRLFTIYSTLLSPVSQMDQYDFSMLGRAKYLWNPVRRELETVMSLSPIRAASRFLQHDGLHHMGWGHDSVAFLCVSVGVS